MDFNEFHNLPLIKARDDLDRKEGKKTIVDIENEKLKQEPDPSFNDPALTQEIQAAEKELNKTEDSLEISDINTSAIPKELQDIQEKTSTDNSFVPKVSTPTINSTTRTVTDGKEVKDKDDKGPEI